MELIYNSVNINPIYIAVSISNKNDFASKLETSTKLESNSLSNEMGLFLQKTNITRDFAEDLEMGRIFWPEESWKNKASNLKSKLTKLVSAM